MARLRVPNDARAPPCMGDRSLPETEQLICAPARHHCLPDEPTAAARTDQASSCGSGRSRAAGNGTSTRARRRRPPHHHSGYKLSSTRRFFARPSSVSFDVTGSASSNPFAATSACFIPCEIRKCITASARICDSIWLDAIPLAASSGPIGVLSVNR